MGVSKFEDLRVWQRAIALSSRLGTLTNGPEFARNADLRDQLNSASLSIANNISEGFLRNRDREFLQFLRIAAGSNGEVRSCLHAARGRSCISTVEADAMIEETNVIGRMIRRLQETLREPRPRSKPRTKDEPEHKDEPRPKD